MTEQEQLRQHDDQLWEQFKKDFDEKWPTLPMYDTESCKHYVREAALFAVKRQNELLEEILDWMIENDYECGPRGSKLYNEIQQRLNPKQP